MRFRRSWVPDLALRANPGIGVWCVALFLIALILSACGPNIGALEKGEEGKVARAYGGDTLELESGLRVFLAEIDAPRGEQEYAAQAQGELEALALHRKVLLAYGGTRRWVRRAREGEPAPAEAATETAIAHVTCKARAGAGSGCSMSLCRAAQRSCARGATITPAAAN